MRLRLRKNLVNFISNGPILVVWVTHKQFELEGLIQKLFTVKPRANVYSNLDKANNSVVVLIRFVDKVYQLLIINYRLQALKRFGGLFGGLLGCLVFFMVE